MTERQLVPSQADGNTLVSRAATDTCARGAPWPPPVLLGEVATCCYQQEASHCPLPCQLAWLGLCRRRKALFPPAPCEGAGAAAGAHASFPGHQKPPVLLSGHFVSPRSPPSQGTQPGNDGDRLAPSRTAREQGTLCFSCGFPAVHWSCWIFGCSATFILTWCGSFWSGLPAGWIFCILRYTEKNLELFCGILIQGI